ncbi:hypothetical protein A1O1_08445 [Capronia coronata CBS 617.96]|uniref:Roadblock/LAMTOR2 domain-containing protein n=1 Tax=Capronia coronata CBS 617.96 TaxID=1182541 RepID=W9XJC3_9EURO|nr:uncharacterized protein A1O1_08445 [Capronia coronata CBS 617.96]EXJ80303.1 hypothetical protein A1O1_08445 [Capronia coronata CBS 617.96]
MVQAERASLCSNILSTPQTTDHLAQALNGPSIDAMLRGLTERPNVQSTLILSRRDGSIIRATGVAGSKTSSTSTTTPGAGAGAGAIYPQYPHAGAQLGPRISSESATDAAAQGSAEVTETTQGIQPEPGPEPEPEPEPELEPVELLASSIFQFVSTADALGGTLGTVSRGAAGPEGPRGGAVAYSENTREDAGLEEDADQTRAEDDVQLLRLRTKHQEIIIFPDPKYICCVVQRMGKTVTGANARR